MISSRLSCILYCMCGGQENAWLREGYRGAESLRRVPDLAARAIVR
jgi:hypothetical protein